jgi:predicted amidohydrolase YtcJ
MLGILALHVTFAAPAFSQVAETVFVNGKILTVDSQSSIRQALAVRDGKIAAVGSNADVRKFAGSGTRTIDLQGRTMIPGLIDSHLHAIRAALSFSTEVNWIGATALADGLGRVREAAQRSKLGAWLIVVTPQATLDRFPEQRRPTQAELIAAAGDHPAYVQLGYGWVLMTPLALQTLHIQSDRDLPARATLEKDAAGKFTGAVTGNIVDLFDRLPKPTFDEELQGTRIFFRELNRLGMTGVVDPGGNNMTPPDYEAVFKTWRDGGMTVRVAYSLCGMTPGKEFEEYQNYLAMMPMGFGDDMLHFNGIGERITWAMNNATNPSKDDQERYYEIVKWAAQHGMTLTMHWSNDQNADILLSIYERVNREVPITGLRWTVAHLNNASERSLQRMKAMGMGWTVQDALYHGGEEYQKQQGVEATRRSPPVNTAEKMGVVIGAGTDAHRVASYNPFTALQWFLDGKTAKGTPLRGPEETPSRADALRFYTMGSAWVSHDEDKRGSLEVGKLADLAVLSTDYMNAPVEQIGNTVSLLTMVGGKIVYAAGPYTKWEERSLSTKAAR